MNALDPCVWRQTCLCNRIVPECPILAAPHVDSYPSCSRELRLPKGYPTVLGRLKANRLKYLVPCSHTARLLIRPDGTGFRLPMLNDPDVPEHETDRERERN